MAKRRSNNPADFIMPLNMNGMEGRMLHMPAPAKTKSKEILFVYGHHSSLERWWGVIKVLNRYAAVTMPDLPGFGGMESFYKIGKQPTIDNLADYLAAFVKMRYKHKRVTIVGLSFGFVVVTRMLQRYPELAEKVDMLVSIVGFSHHEDFVFSKTRHRLYLNGTRFFAHRLPAAFFRHIVLRPLFIRTIYARTHNAQPRFKDVETREEFNQLMDVEIDLWHCNDVRTYMFTTTQFLRVDNCDRRVDLPVWHVSAEADHYFDEHRVEQHLRVIFADLHHVKTKLSTHAPSVIADEKMAAPLIPIRLRQVFSKM